MLKIATQTLPKSTLGYVSFRIALKDTLERFTLAAQVGTLHDSKFGYLTEVPFLASVPPHVQLDLLARTWQRHLDASPHEADLVDESVIYAVCETAARLVEDEPREVRRYLEKGPTEVDFEIDHFLAAEIRALHLNLPNEGDFLLVSQFEDMPPERAQTLKRKFGLDERDLDVLFDVLGRWHVGVDFAANLEGLVAENERLRIDRTLRQAGAPLHDG